MGQWSPMFRTLTYVIKLKAVSLVPALCSINSYVIFVSTRLS